MWSSGSMATSKRARLHPNPASPFESAQATHHTDRPYNEPSLARRKSRPYEPMKYPEERIQIDVKNTFQKNTYFIKPFIEKYDRTDLYQYTAIDEYFRHCIVCRCTYSSSLFLCRVASQFKALGRECVQTGNYLLSTSSTLLRTIQNEPYRRNDS